MATTKPDSGYRLVTVPCDAGDAAFLVERRAGTRIAVRIDKLALFFTFNEAKNVAEAILGLLSAQSGGLRWAK